MCLLWYNYTIKGSDFLGSNYNKNLFKQFEETLKKVDFLMEENKALKIEIATMKENHKKEITLLNSKITALEAENNKLKNIINKDSGNSSKPPSSDGFKKISNSREKTGKSVGGQMGHRGDTLKFFDNPTKIVEHKKKTCKCGCLISYDEKYKAKQFVDIEIKTNIVEHRAYSGVCSGCNAVVTNQMPKELINNVTYGNTIKGFSSILNSEGIISTNRIKQMISEFTNGTINLSEGTIVNWLSELSSKLLPTINAIKENLLVSPVNHKDETGFRINNSLHWFHVLSNKTNTLYFPHIKRGNVADEAQDILPSYSGVLMHDHLKGLYSFNCKHAECNAHILRYLKSVTENEDKIWAKEMIKFLVDINNEIKNLKSDGTYCYAESQIQDYYEKYDKILSSGQDEFKNDQNTRKNYNSEGMKLLRRLREYKKEHLRFIADFNVPFDNNLAERDLRMIKAKSKISGCFRSEKGSKDFANIKSYTSTLKKRKENIYQGVILSFLGSPVIV